MLRINQLIIAVAIAAVTVTTGGCAAQVNRQMRDSKDRYDTANDLMSGFRAQQGPNERPSVVVTEQQYIDPTPVPYDKKTAQAAARTCEVKFPGGRKTVDQFAQLLRASDCHLQVTFTAEARRRLSGENAGAAPATAVAAPVPPAPYGNVMLPSAPGVPAATYGLGSSPDFASPVTIDMAYSGDVDGLLDRAAAQLGLFYNRDAAGNVSFFYTETRTYRIDVDADIATTRVNVVQGTTVQTGTSGGSGNGSSSSSGANSGGDQTTTITQSNNFSEDFKEAIKQLMSKDGRFAYSASTGLLTATDTPDRLDAVSLYVDKTNHFGTMQVVLNFTVGVFQATRSSHHQLDLELAYKSLRGKGVSLTNNFPVDNGGVSGGISVLDTATGNLGNFAGSKIFLNALEEQGHVDVLRRPSLMAINMQPTPMQNATETTYLAQSSNSLTSGGTATGFSQTSLVPGTVTTGFSVTAKPFIHADGKTMTLTFDMNLSQLTRLRDIVSGDTKIQGPEVAKNIIHQKLIVRSGETIIISGLQQDDNSSSKSGTVSPSFWGLGGGNSLDKGTSTGLVIVQPVII